MKKQGRNLSIFIFATTLFFLSPASAVVLFKDGEQVANYNLIVHSLNGNDILTFSNGKSFQIKRALNHGDTTLILETVDGLALRIPLWKGIYIRKGFTRGHPYKLYIDSFFLGYQRIKDTIRIAKVYDYLPGEYLLVEKVDVKFTLLDFLEGRVAVSPTEKKRLIGLLVNWAETTKDFVKIGDFDEEQLGFNGKEWVLLDVSGKGETVIEQKKSNSFDIGNNIFKIGSQYALPEESFRFSTEELKNIYQLLGSKIVKARIQSTSCREVHQYR